MAEILGIRAFNRSQRVRVGLKELTTNKTAFVNLDNGRVRRDLQNHSSIGAFLTVSTIQSIGVAGGFIVANGVITDPNPADLKLNVDSGVVEVNGVRKSFNATEVTITSADATNPRIDAIVVNPTTGAVTVTAGTAAASPVPPTVTTNVVVATVRVPAAATAVTLSNVTDYR